MTAPVAFLDTEALGLDPDRHVIWEVGLILPSVAVETWFRRRRNAVLPGRVDAEPIGDDGVGDHVGLSWQLEVEPYHLDNSDAEGRRISGYDKRYDAARAIPRLAGLGLLAELLHPAENPGEAPRPFHLAGAVVSFDEERLRRELVRKKIPVPWHYHLIDVENLAVGYLAGCRRAISAAAPSTGEAFWAGTTAWTATEGPDHRPPWDSEELSRAVGVDPAHFDRHTALGDARWAKAICEAVTAG